MINRMPRFFQRTVSTFLCLSTLAAFAGCQKPSDKTIHSTNTSGSDAVIDEAYDAEIKSGSQPVLVTDSDRMELYMDGSTACVTLKDKITGNVWTTNPVGRESDPAAQGTNLDQLSSQIILEYAESGKKTKVDSYSQSIALQQYSFYPVENGIGVNYLIGKKPRVFIVPQVLTVARYEEIKKKITDENDMFIFESYYRKADLAELPTEADKTLFLEVFPILKEHPIYYFATPGSLGLQSDGDQVASDFMLEQVETVFVNIGYTAEDMKKDHEENKVDNAEKPDYSVSLRLEYRLDANNLVVTVPENSISYRRSTIQLENIWINPYFGAANNSKNGYMMVPSGSGALINLNNGKTNLEAYETELLYGDDPLFEEPPKQQKIDVQAHLPVFGLKQDNTAFLGIVEKGDGSVFIEADISGRTHSYNHVCPKFQLARPQRQDTAIMNLTDFDIYPERDLSGALQIRYLPLQQENADYSGMATAYRQYLMDHNMLHQRKIEEQLPSHLRVIGAVTYQHSVLGIPVKSSKALTTYEETIQILQELKKSGVSNMVLELSDWANGGRENTAYNRIKLLDSLGGKSGFEALFSYVKQNDIAFYPAIDLQKVRKDTIMDGFNAKKMAARTLNKRIAYNYNYKLTTFEKTKDSSAIVVSPNQYSTMLDGVLKDLERYELKGISAGLLGKQLTSDHNSKKITDRQQSLEIVQKQLEKMSGKYNVLVRSANRYALSAASVITDAPLTSDNHYMCDRSIPFYQMVLHGVVPVAGTPMNYAGDFEADKLALLEAGAFPSFEFIYRDNYELKDTVYNIYGVNYKLWLQQAAKLYQELNEALKGCHNAKIVRHQQLRNDVSCTTYDNGVSIIVNQGDSPFVYEGQEIAANSYIRVEGKTNGQ